jgi:hypothetical protein
MGQGLQRSCTDFGSVIPWRTLLCWVLGSISVQLGGAAGRMGVGLPAPFTESRLPSSRSSACRRSSRRMGTVLVLTQLYWSVVSSLTQRYSGGCSRGYGWVWGRVSLC